MTETEHENRCPLSAVDRRLEDVHRYWHEAERGYFDPESFRVAIQTAIQTLRTVTFIVQSNKRLFSKFDPWYEAWQDKLRADPLMRWMVDARNKIEKQGDLEAHSLIRAEIVASYYEEGPRMEVPAELFQSPAELISGVPTEALRNHVFKNGILRIQRRWVENSLPDYELLDAVGIAYGRVAELVADAHLELGLEPPSTMVGDIDRTQGEESRRGRLPCMIGHGDARSHNVWLATGQSIEIEQKTVEFDREQAELVASKYELDPNKIFPSTTPTPEATLNGLFATARKMFIVDGHNDTIAFLLNGARPLHLMQLNIQEHGEKYLVMRTLANEVIKCGADGVIVISEVWSAPYDPSKPYRRAVDAPERREFLTATLVTKAGDPVQLHAPINRTGDIVTLGDTETILDQAQVAFAPIYSAWGREIPEAWIEMMESRTEDEVSEDDAKTMTGSRNDGTGIPQQSVLPARNSDCPCGSGEKFKRCCSDRLPGWQLGNHTRNALAAEDFASALVACRADITQYTIWHKAHTDPLLNSAPEAVENFLNLDIRALAELAELLERCYKKAGKSNEFPATLERLRQNINHPRWHRKIIYLQAFHALSTNDNERAARRELRKLGSMELETDVETLQLYIQLFHDDLSFADKQKLVDRVILLTDSAIEKLHYRCIKAMDFLFIGNANDAAQELSAAVDTYSNDTSRKTDSLYERHRYAMALDLLGRLKNEQQYIDEGLAICRELLEKDGWTESGKADILRQLGDGLRFKEDWAAARDFYKQAYAMQPLSILQVFLAECLVETDGCEEAAKAIRVVSLGNLDATEFVDYVFTFALVAIEGGDRDMLVEAENLLRNLNIPTPYFRERRDALVLEVIDAVRNGKSLAGTNRARSLLKGMASTVIRYMKLEPNFMGIGINLGKILEDLSTSKQAHSTKRRN